MANLNPELAAAVNDAVARALASEADNKNNTLTQKDAARVTNPVADKVEAAVKPFVDHATNQEPWYQSRVTWGALVAAGAGVAGIVGYTFDADDQAYIVDSISSAVELGVSVAALVGGFLAWYGRWRAKKPIGQ